MLSSRLDPVGFTHKSLDDVRVDITYSRSVITLSLTNVSYLCFLSSDIYDHTFAKRKKLSFLMFHLQDVFKCKWIFSSTHPTLVIKCPCLVFCVTLKKQVVFVQCLMTKILFSDVHNQFLKHLKDLNLLMDIWFWHLCLKENYCHNLFHTLKRRHGAVGCMSDS